MDGRNRKQTNREGDYQFWLEEEGVKDRLANDKIGYDENKSIILNALEGRIGELKEIEAQKLKQYLMKSPN